MNINKCKYCKGDMVNTGAPIWEDFCPNENCVEDYRKEFYKGVRESIEDSEYKEYLRLKEKYE